MARLLVAVVLALLIGQALAAPAFAATAACTAACPDAGSGEDCSPVCFDCGCCGYLARILAPSPGLSAPISPASRRAVTGDTARLPAWPPRDVLHVPLALG